MMSEPRLPAELLDYIVDLLHNTRDALKSCCLVSKSWIARARKHLFANIAFGPQGNVSVELWKVTFPEPSTSPACYTRSLVIKYPMAVATADAGEGGWITTFSQVEDFQFDFLTMTINPMSISYLVPFHGFSPILKSLSVMYTAFHPSGLFNLIQSFPRLESLYLANEDSSRGGDGFDPQPDVIPLPTSPPFTGSLVLVLRPSMSPIVPRLLSPSYSLHFRKLHLVLCHGQDVAWTAELVKGCTSTLEFLRIDCGISESIQHLQRINDFPTFAVEPSAGSINLSRAKRLQVAEFGYQVYLPFVIATLRTVTDGHRNLQRISIETIDLLVARDLNYSDPASFVHAIGAAYREWLELDGVLAGLSEAHSIRVKVLYKAPERIDGKISRSCLEMLLPELTKGGVVDLVEWEGTWAA